MAHMMGGLGGMGKMARQMGAGAKSGGGPAPKLRGRFKRSATVRNRPSGIRSVILWHYLNSEVKSMPSTN